MRGVRLERAVLIEGRHHDRDDELLVGRGIDEETADLLLRQQAAVALDADKAKPNSRPNRT